MDRSKCVILVSYGVLGIEPECERGLKELEARGYAVRRRAGSAIDLARSQMSTEALDDGFEEIFWIDADVVFNPDDVDRLRERGLPFVSGIYPKKGERAIASNVADGTKRIVFGEGGGLVEIAFAAAGFILCRREVFERIAERLPVCNQGLGKRVIPFFMPTVGLRDGKPWYLGEDFAFSARAREVGFTVYADTTIRLQHIGRYLYSWEDAGSVLPRYETFTLELS